jgi:hypothetical protein
MSEFTFACPICGQNISGDTTLGGAQHICPHCNNTIGVPTPFAADAGVIMDAVDTTAAFCKSLRNET